MKKNYPSFEEWIVTQKGFEKGPDARYFATMDYETRDIDIDEKTLVVTISSKAKDRMGDVLDSRGVRLENYRKNPVVLWAHDYKSKPIAKSLWQKVSSGKIVAKPKFANTPEATEIFNLYRDGFLHAWSVGFIPEKFEPRFKKGKAEDDESDETFEGYDISEWELLEYSAVPVPANPTALTNAYNQGKIKSPMLIKAFGLDSIQPKIEPDKEIVGDAHTVISDEAEKKLLKEANAAIKTATFKYCVCEKCGYWEDKKAGDPCQDHKCPGCGAPLKGSNEKPEAKAAIPYKNLGKEDEDAEWDAGQEVHDADTDDLKLMCAWYDSDKPDIKSSYKLPHHRAGTHKSVWRGVAAAMGALLGARGGVAIPAGDKKGVYNHLVGHYKEYDKEPPEFKDMPDETVLKPEETEDKIHIPVRDKGDFVNDSFRTIDISKDEGIRAVIGKLKSDPAGPTVVQKYIFDKSKGWTMDKAKKWVEEHKKRADYIENVINESRENLIGRLLESNKNHIAEIHRGQDDRRANDALAKEVKELQEAFAALKEGRVISTKNLKLLKDARDALTAVIDMAEREKEKPEDEGKSAPMGISVDVGLLARKMAEAIGIKTKEEFIAKIRKMQGKID